ncbi:rCG45917 [Rattus norvegicus]|uniref:RCG45917 n=1 Tax=Rattus norvegicus TaxID=10116 RepID=A6JTM8_RAT|nr:rCG45917 [Rattus norvegicus]
MSIPEGIKRRPAEDDIF